jgi:hypothetical protein
MMLERLRPWRPPFFVCLAAVLIAGQARAADTGNGSKNFSTPQTVPNYFSNEAGPMLGPGSETQRGPLYMGQTYGTMQAAATAAPAAPSYRQHVAMAEPRGRLIRGRGGRLVPHHIAVHGRTVTRVAAHGSSLRAHTAYASGHASHSVGRATTRVSTAHRHARG